MNVIPTIFVMKNGVYQSTITHRKYKQLVNGQK